MTEAIKKQIIKKAFAAGFRYVACEKQAAAVLHEAEVIQAAPHMLAITEADLLQFIHAIRKEEREETVLSCAFGMMASSEAALAYYRRNNDLLAKNVELERRIANSIEIPSEVNS